MQTVQITDSGKTGTEAGKFSSAGTSPKNLFQSTFSAHLDLCGFEQPAELHCGKRQSHKTVNDEFETEHGCLLIGLTALDVTLGIAANAAVLGITKRRVGSSPRAACG
jgi:hypothetical protein